MATNLIQLARSQLTPEIIERASALVGEPPDRTRRAAEAAMPALFAGIGDTASSPSGADQLLNILGEAGFIGPAAGPLDRLQGDAGAQSVLQAGKELLGRVLGNRAGAVVEATASATGLGRSTMHALLALLAPLALGVLGREVHARHLDAAGLSGLLEEQKRAAVEAVPVNGPTRVPVLAAGERVPPPAGLRRTWPLLLLLPVIIAGALLFRRREPTAPTPVPRAGEESAPVVRELPAEPPRQVEIRLPGGGVQRFSEGATGYRLAQFLASPSEATPKRFVFDDLDFDTATSRLTPASLATIGGVAAVLKAYPSAEILIEGHTDNVGDPAANQALSKGRAEAVKHALVAQGIAPERIRVAGLGQDRPLASNDTEEGRARNRRTELVVVRR